jgi:dTDP-4-amino-4,6-dideoxygalactose transaminase
MLPFTRPTIGDEEHAAIREVLESGWLASGPKVLAFEQALQDYIGGGVQVRVLNSATSALEAALLACDVGPGDEVIVPALSFAATANVVVRVGARPVFVDVDLRTRNLDVTAVEAALTPRTRAVIPVHLCGLAAELAPIYDLAHRHRVIVIEDCAHAIGTEYQSRRIGSFGDTQVFSFHPNKNITTVEGGCIASSDRRLIGRIERLRFHGIERDADGNVDVPELGGKWNMPDVGAALGLAQLAKLDDFNRRRRTLARRYFERLPHHPALLPPADGAGHSWHMFCVCVDYPALGTTRPVFQRALAARDIGTGIHYPAIHLFGLYRRYGYAPGDFPNAERIGAQTLTLPLFPAMTEADVDRVCDALAELLTKGVS